MLHTQRERRTCVKLSTQLVSKDMLVRSASGCKQQQHKKLIQNNKNASVVIDSFEVAQTVHFLRSLPFQENVYKNVDFGTPQSLSIICGYRIPPPASLSWRLFRVRFS